MNDAVPEFTEQELDIVRAILRYVDDILEATATVLKLQQSML